MAILTDKTKLTLGVEVVLNTTSNPRTIQLVATGDLTTDGVTLDTVYEALKLFWRNDSTLPKFQFPMNPITNEQFDLVADAANVGWDWKDDTTRYLIKTGGWAIKDNAGVSKEEWAGIISLGSIAGADQPYFIQVAGGTVVNFQNTGPINQAVKVYGDLTHDNFDYRSYFQMFIRTQGKIYASAALTDIGQTVMTYKVYAFPLAESTDPTILDSDVTVGAFGITATWYAAPQNRTIGGVSYPFHVIIDGNSKTAEEIYEGIELMLRKATDIDKGAGTKIDKITNALAIFTPGVGLQTLLDSVGGVYIDNILTTDINRIKYTDDSGTVRSSPFIAALTLTFNSNLVNDTNANFHVYFTTNPTGDFGTADAVVVNDATPAAMTGSVGGLTSKTYTFAYEANVQGGRTAGTDAAITVVAIGLATAQYVLATGTIGRNTTNTVALSAALERNYA